VLFGARDVRLMIRQAALNLMQVIITYRKITTGERKMYRVAPYSYRYRHVRIGLTRLLFAYDMEDKHIKGFVLKNISKIVLLDKKFRPKWEVEF
jgi:predicted DNA-binding transcriptional regulator YafY